MELGLGGLAEGGSRGCAFGAAPGNHLGDGENARYGMRLTDHLGSASGRDSGVSYGAAEGCSIGACGSKYPASQVFYVFPANAKIMR